MKFEEPRLFQRALPIDFGKRLVMVLLCVTVFPAFSGCNPRPTTVDNGYGRLTGAGYRTSVNGTRVFANMLESHGPKVDKYTRLTPRIDRYGTIVFFPEDRAAPSQETVDRIETWLSDSDSRTFVYVGRDFDAEIDYWQTMLDNPDEFLKAHARRRLARSMTAQDQARLARNESWNATGGFGQQAPADCDWFQSTQFADRSATSLDGPLARGVDLNASHIPYHTLLSPNTSWQGGIEQLLTVDGEIFAFTIRRNEWNDGKIIVISNAAFLLNYPLINLENREMAGNLIDQIQYSKEVLFLESGSDIQISNSDYDNHNRWAWITKPPLKYIVPQFLFWGILFCFVFFPIFGRPRHYPRKSSTNFKHHISAMGRLLLRTKSPSQVLKWIQDYRTMSSNPRNRRQDS